MFPSGNRRDGAIIFGFAVSFVVGMQLVRPVYTTHVFDIIANRFGLDFVQNEPSLCLLCTFTTSEPWKLEASRKGLVSFHVEKDPF
jgi:hypothetical protein